MRVLQVIGSMDCGGAETFIMNLYRQIDKSEVQFDFVVHTSSDMYYQDEIYVLGGKIYRAPRFTGINYRAYGMFTSGRYRSLWAACGKFQPF